MVGLHRVTLAMILSLNASWGGASPEDAVGYRLVSESWFGEVCELCYCPDSIAELRGTFLLRPTGEKGGFRTFDVLDVEWETRVGSERVAVTGSGFQSGATVDFGSRIAVQNVAFVNSSELTVGIKIHRRASGSRDVTVSNPDGNSATGLDCFTVN